eukprot:scaffold55524_cov38-Cyclotella_meneghiniana.AAC.4
MPRQHFENDDCLNGDNHVATGCDLAIERDSFSLGFSVVQDGNRTERNTELVAPTLNHLYHSQRKTANPSNSTSSSQHNPNT